MRPALRKKKTLVWLIVGILALLIVAAGVGVALSKRSQAHGTAARLLGDISIADARTAYYKVHDSSCQTQVGAFTQWYLRCSVDGEKFYHGHGDTAALVGDLHVLDQKLRASGWRTYDVDTSATSRVPTTEDINLGKPNGTGLWTVYYMPSQPNLLLVMTYITEWTSHEDAPYKTIHQASHPSGSDYLFGVSVSDDYINISS
jgi:hypothetical protein